MDVFKNGRVLPFISSIILLSLGILMLIMPDMISNMLGLILGSILIATGIMHILYSIISKEYRDLGGIRLILGLTTTMFGVLMLCWHFTLPSMREIALLAALWGIINGSIKFANFPTLKSSGKNFVWEIVFGVLQILLGANILVMYLFTSQFWMLMAIGALTVLTGLSVLIMAFWYSKVSSSVRRYRAKGESHNPHYA